MAVRIALPDIGTLQQLARHHVNVPVHHHRRLRLHRRDREPHQARQENRPSVTHHLDNPANLPLSSTCKCSWFQIIAAGGRGAASAATLAAAITPAAAQSDSPSVQRLTDPVTKRSIIRYASPHHETHHYYFISPWSPDGKQLVFFQFDQGVDKLTARGRYPGALSVMNADGSGRRRLSGTQGLMGHYHVGVNQFWSNGGESVYYTDTSARPARLMEANAATGAVKAVDTPVPCGRISPKGDTLSCGTGQQWGVYDVSERRYRRLVTLERALALSPNKELGRGLASQLQNTRYSPSGDRVMIVHRTVDDPPRQIEIFVYDFRSEELTYLAHNLHHPCWRPDGKAILFVRWDERQRMQNLWEVNMSTKVERCVYPRHLSCVHASYHPTRQNLVVADCSAASSATDWCSSTQRPRRRATWSRSHKARAPMSSPTTASPSANSASGCRRASTSTNRAPCGARMAQRCSSPARRAGGSISTSPTRLTSPGHDTASRLVRTRIAVVSLPLPWPLPRRQRHPLRAALPL